MMQEQSQLYTPSVLQFSPSRLYFQHQNQILQKMGFISPMSIDIHFKYTFQEIQPTYFIEGGEFEGLTVDHDVHEQGIIYKIGLLNPKFQKIEHIALDFKNSYFDNPSIWPLVRGLLGWFIVFALLAWLSSKFQFGQVLLWLNLIGALILLVFYGRKIGKVLYKKAFKTKNLDYGGFAVNYTNQTDALMLSGEVLGVLKKMEKEYRITKFGYTGNCIYLLQDLHDREGNRLSESSKLYSEQEKANLQQRTMEYIRQPEFLSQFTLD